MIYLILKVNSSLIEKNTTLENKTHAPIIDLEYLNLIWQVPYAFGVVFSNALVLYIVTWKIREKSFSNLCLCFLAISDLIIGLVCLPDIIYDTYHHNEMNIYVRKVFYTIRIAQPAISLFILSVLTWHRLIQFYKPNKTSERLTGFKVGVLVSIWVVIYLISALTIIFQEDMVRALKQTMYFLLYFMPIVVNICLVTITISILFSRHRKLSSTLRKGTVHKKFQKTALQSTFKNMLQASITVSVIAPKNVSLNNNLRLNDKSNQRIIARELKAIFYLVIIIFTLGITKSFGLVIWYLSNSNTSDDPSSNPLAIWLGYLNSLVNPIVIFIFHDAVRCKIQQMAIQICKRRNININRTYRVRAF